MICILYTLALIDSENMCTCKFLLKVYMLNMQTSLDVLKRIKAFQDLAFNA